MKNTRYRIYPMKSLILFVLCWKAATGLSVSGGQPQHPSTRRKVLALLAPSVAFGPLTANAYNTKRSRSDGYTVQRKDSEWRSILSPTQYFILREGGTERPYSSILESEERSGAYKCAGCGTELFESTQKFHSGTGWVSYLHPVSALQYNNLLNMFHFFVCTALCAAIVRHGFAWGRD
jgi:peptide methionine sulfoxide reductase MsrB